MNKWKFLASIIIGLYGMASFWIGVYHTETNITKAIDDDCKNIGAFVLNGKFYRCEPKEWNHSNLQE